ncbi:protein ABHD11-like [Aphidius gifuensis]|uniref:protein ABHD11-like n=1 Tax=Aphidius gifuensis TaxID=684658 RepID=UPI001CDD904D|nr:protein ABHD11-like [Aphidius gifuensis]
MLLKKLSTILSRSFHTSVISRSSVKLAYKLHDVDSSKDKLPIVIMDGLLGFKENWQYIGHKLSENTKRKVITIDTRNHGESPTTEVMTYKLLADDIKSLLSHLGYEKTVLVGWSLGGSTMMLRTLCEPSSVEKLIVIDISPVRIPPLVYTFPAVFNYLKDYDFSGSKNQQDAVDKLDVYLAKRINNPATRDWITSGVVEKNNGMFGFKFNLELIIKNFEANLGDYISAIDENKAVDKFEGQTLFIGGSFSHYIPTEDHDKIKCIFPNCQFRYIEGVGHFVPRNKPREVVQLVTEFINK